MTNDLDKALNTDLNGKLGERSTISYEEENDNFARSSSSTSSSANANNNGKQFSAKLNSQFEACKNGCINSVRELVNRDNVNLKDTSGRKSTCLHFAAGFGRKDVCEYLLNECGADPSLKDEG